MDLHHVLAGIRPFPAAGAPDITAVHHDSRKVGPGSLFCCLTGLHEDGHQYAAAAVRRGAVALLCERKLPIAVPQIIVPDTRAAMALACGNFFGNPAAHMVILGITGTNGKTSATHMLQAIGRAFGKKVGLIGTVGAMIDGEKLAFETATSTTPDPWDLHGLLRRMADAGVQWVAMEVTAHALWLRKLAGIKFAAAGFLNLTQDHLNDFGTMAAYFDAKKKLFAGHSLQAAVCVDQPELARLFEDLTLPKISFGEADNAEVRVSDIALRPDGVDLRLGDADKGVDVTLPMPGRFSAQNAACAAAIARLLGVPWAVIRVGLMNARVPGRMESVSGGIAHFYVDYAHTPDGLENTLSSARALCRGKLWAVFGCGGDRDAGKRPSMGAIAGQLADHIILTSDNPRSEDPDAIIAQIADGLPEGVDAVRLADRAEALAYAVAHAATGDVVIVAGKGHEDYQEINGAKRPFDDREVLARLLN